MARKKRKAPAGEEQVRKKLKGRVRHPYITGQNLSGSQAGEEEREGEEKERREDP